MQTLTLADIRAKNPCYDPATKVPETWTGTVADVLRLENVTPEDRLWVATKFLDDKTLRLFAVWCAREALKLVKNPDPRSVAACDVAERFANGEATAGELAAASAAADAYAASAAYAAAYASADAAYASARKAQVAHLLTMIDGPK